MNVFQSTPSVWRVTNFFAKCDYCGKISIHTLRVEGDFLNATEMNGALRISIHTLRVEGDDVKKLDNAEAQRISIHTLRVEGDLVKTALNVNAIIFQSTPSVWRVTKLWLRIYQV